MKALRQLLSQLLTTTVLLLSVSEAMAQTRTIQGQVKAAGDAEGLPGANVLFKGTTVGTITDIDGNFKIAYDGPSTILVVSFLGYQTQEIEVANVSTIDVLLMEDVEALEEVVITGYFSESKKLSTGSSTVIESELVSRSANSSFQEGLQGLSPGVDVSGASGAVGGAVNIKIRGTGSLSSIGTPLYVINGIPMSAYPSDGIGNFGTTYNPMTNINPDDIETYKILRDAEATALYGSRGANGVILITTKSGSKGKPQFEVSYSYGLSEPTNMLKHLNTRDWIIYHEEGYANAGFDPASYRLPLTKVDGGWYTDEVARSTDIDKYEEVYRVGASHNASLSMSGGTEQVTYRLNGSVGLNEGILKQNDNERLSFSGAFDIKLNDKMKATFNTMISNTFNSQYPTNIYFLSVPGEGGTVFQWWGQPVGLNFIRSALPMYPARDPDGTFFETSSLTNVYPAMDDDYFFHQNKTFNMINSANYTYTITPDLTFESKFGLTYTGYQQQVWFSPLVTNLAVKGNCDDCRGFAEQTMRHSTNLNTTLTMRYNKEINRNSIDFAIGYENYTSNDRRTIAQGVGFPPTNSIKSVGAAEEPLTWGASESGVVFYSGFFRAKYAYNQKYILSTSFRADGSSRFGAHNRWGYFPSVSLGWNVSDEGFLKSSGVINYLKLRSSYGISGNAEIDQSAAFYNWNFNNQSYAGSQGITPKRLQESTDNIGWEKAYTLDVGLDYEILNSRISGELSYYRRKSTDLLAKLTTPLSAGGNEFLTNAGVVQNLGFESSLTGVLVDRDFKWSLTFNITYQKNEVVSLIDDPRVFQTDRQLGIPVIGGSVADYNMVKWLGVDPATGNELFEDPETGQPYQFIDPARPSQAEMRNLVQHIDGASGIPRLIGGLSSNISYKGISFNLLFSFREGFSIYDDDLNYMAYMRSNNAVSNVPQFMFDNRWQNPGDITDVPRPIYNHSLAGDPNLGTRSTRFLYDGSFIRLRNATIAYDVPDYLCKVLKLKVARIYIQGTNLLTFTRYPGWDPEGQNSIGTFSPIDANIEPNLVKGNPPQARTYKVGLNFTF